MPHAELMEENWRRQIPNENDANLFTVRLGILVGTYILVYLMVVIIFLLYQFRVEVIV